MKKITLSLFIASFLLIGGVSLNQSAVSQDVAIGGYVPDPWPTGYSIAPTQDVAIGGYVPDPWPTGYAAPAPNKQDVAIGGYVPDPWPTGFKADNLFL